MKYVLMVGDGMADLPVAELGGLTPLQSALTPNMDRLAGGEIGLLRTCPDGLPPGSDVAFLSLHGHDPLTCYTGRSPLEAAGEGIDIAPGDVSFRINLISIRGDYQNGTMDSYNGDGVHGADALALMRGLLADEHFARLVNDIGMRIAPTDTFRHIAVMRAGDGDEFELAPAHNIAGRPLRDHLPGGAYSEVFDAMQRRAHEVLSGHEVNARRAVEGRLPANGIWLWGAGRAAKLDNFETKYGVSGEIISAVPLVRGIAALSGLGAPRIPGATGEIETNYAGKVSAALGALANGRDFALIHLEAPDDMGHQGDAPGKREAIMRFDERIVGPMLEGLDSAGYDYYRVLMLPDHYTLLSTKAHDATPVPYALYDSRSPGAARKFSEATCAGSDVAPSGDVLLRRLLEIG